MEQWREKETQFRQAERFDPVLEEHLIKSFPLTADLAGKA